MGRVQQPTVTDGTYLINNLYPAIQGEGVQTGVPMALLRLHGCDVGCPWCDTKETWQIDPAWAVTTLDEALGANPKYCDVPISWRDCAAPALPAAGWTRTRLAGTGAWVASGPNANVEWRVAQYIRPLVSGDVTHDETPIFGSVAPGFC